MQIIRYDNLLHGQTYGLEIAAHYQVNDRWDLNLGYTREWLHLKTDPTSLDTVTPLFDENGTPHNSAQLRSHLEIGYGLAWDAAAYYVDRLTNQGYTNATIPAYTRLDSGLAWKASERFSLSLVGQNLLRDHHLEFEDIFGSLQSGQMKRSVYGRLIWKF